MTRRATRLVLDRGWISAAEVHTHGVRARDLSQSNGVVLVESGCGRCFVAKDMRREACLGQGDPEAELAVYRAVAGHAELEGRAPALLEVDESEGLMILEGLGSSRRLDHLDGGKRTLDPEIAVWLGDALASWHRGAERLCGFAEVRPWLLDIDRDERLPILDEVPELGEATAEALRDADRCAAIAFVRAHWRRETVIHGDVRFANVMVLRSPPSLRLIDWETAGWGDPAWDIAGAVQEYLSVGLFGGHALERSPAASPIGALLAAYAGSAGTAVRWSRLAPFVACRLIMRAIQLANWDGDTASAIVEHLEVASRLSRDTAWPFPCEAPEGCAE